MSDKRDREIGEGMDVSLAFDLGGVIFDFDYNIALDRMRDYLNVSSEDIIYALYYEDFALDFERGTETGRQFYEKFKKRFISKDIDYNFFIDVWCDIFSPKTEIIDLIDRLRLIYPVNLISNINEEHFRFLSNKFPYIFSMFDNLLLSYKIKSVKPEKEIYDELIRISRADKIIYIDDRQDLICEAEKLNLECIRFIDYNTLIRDLIRRIYFLNDEEFNALRHLKSVLSDFSYPLIVGLGNIIRGDDGVGFLLAQWLKDIVNISVLNIEHIENNLDRISRMGADLIVFIDAGEFDGDSRFKIFTPEEINDIHIYSTHDFSLKLAIEYLKNIDRIGILILSIKGANFDLGEKMSRHVVETQVILKKFFLRNFVNDENRERSII